MFEIELIICIKMDLALNNLQRLICHKIQPIKPPFNNVQKSSGSFKNMFTNLCIYLVYIYKEGLALNNLQLLMCHKTQWHQIIYI